MSLRRLPLSISDFKKLQEGDYIYVDKTKQIYDVLKSGEAFFLSRPRRFGKSLTISTLNELFLNRKELFKDTWIYNSDWKWREYSIIRIDFSNGISSDSKSTFESDFISYLETIAQSYEFSLEKEVSVTAKTKFLITTLAAINPLAILIDEYDAPLLRQIDKPQLMEEIKEVLQTFYATIKANNHLISYLFITGITRFAKMSIFSGMNNLKDLSFSESVADLCGYTQEELETNYHDHFMVMAQKENMDLPTLLNKIKYWYNGYRFSTKIVSVYNPFSIVYLCDEKKFSNYWYQSGSPSYLVKLLKTHYFKSEGIENKYYPLRSLQNSITPDNNIDFIPLLLQAGYLTMTDYDQEYDRVKLDYPNFENREALETLILALYAGTSELSVLNDIGLIRDALIAYDLDAFFKEFKHLISSIPYMNREKSEGYYSSLFHIAMRVAKLNPHSEVQTHTGRIDTVIEIRNFVYIFEYKFNKTVQEALDQIEEKKYYESYVGSDKKVILVGINFIYTDRVAGTAEGAVFDIEWKAEIKKI